MVDIPFSEYIFTIYRPLDRSSISNIVILVLYSFSFFSRIEYISTFETFTCFDSIEKISFVGFGNSFIALLHVSSSVVNELQLLPTWYEKYLVTAKPPAIANLHGNKKLHQCLFWWS